MTIESKETTEIYSRADCSQTYSVRLQKLAQGIHDMFTLQPPTGVADLLASGARLGILQVVQSAKEVLVSTDGQSEGEETSLSLWHLGGGDEVGRVGCCGRSALVEYSSDRGATGRAFGENEEAVPAGDQTESYTV